MFEVLLTLAVIAIVAWSIFQNYYPPTVLLLAGLVFLAVAAFMGVDPVAAKKSTQFLGFDFAQAFAEQMKTRLRGSALTSCGSPVSRTTWTKSAPQRPWLKRVFVRFRQFGHLTCCWPSPM